MKHQLQFLSVLDACGIAKCSKELIHRAIRDGRLDCFLLTLGAKTILPLRVSLSSIVAFKRCIQAISHFQPSPL